MNVVAPLLKGILELEGGLVVCHMEVMLVWASISKAGPIVKSIEHGLTCR
jgi:hypothetical protein